MCTSKAVGRRQVISREGQSGHYHRPHLRVYNTPTFTITTPCHAGAAYQPCTASRDYIEITGSDPVQNEHHNTNDHTLSSVIHECKSTTTLPANPRPAKARHTYTSPTAAGRRPTTMYEEAGTIHSARLPVLYSTRTADIYTTYVATMYDDQISPEGAPVICLCLRLFNQHPEKGYIAYILATYHHHSTATTSTTTTHSITVYLHI